MMGDRTFVTTDVLPAILNVGAEEGAPDNHLITVISSAKLYLEAPKTCIKRNKLTLSLNISRIAQ